jgi:hypothetical protein
MAALSGIRGGHDHHTYLQKFFDMIHDAVFQSVLMYVCLLGFDFH